MGATAIGTGLNSPPGYAELVTRKLAKLDGFAAPQGTQPGGGNSGRRVLCANVREPEARRGADIKICNDLRWLSSGTRCGLYEITLPAMQPGSSIMPGKVNR